MVTVYFYMILIFSYISKTSKYAINLFIWDISILYLK